MQVSQRVLDSPEALHLDPSVFFQTIQACVAVHEVAQKVCAAIQAGAHGQAGAMQAPYRGLCGGVQSRAKGAWRCTRSR